MLWTGMDADTSSNEIPILRVLMAEELEEETEKEAKAADIDVKVMVKNSFIEVVDPQSQSRMRRSLSDSCLHSSSATEYRHQKAGAVTASGMSKSLLDDFSDDSTAISSDVGGDSQSEFAVRVRNDTCWSDDEGAMDGYVQQYMPAYQYVDEDGGVWWMPMPAFDPVTGAMLNADGSAMEMDAAWMDTQWLDQINAGLQVDDAVAMEPYEVAEWRTTVMLRNMPNNYTRDMLLELVDSMGFEKCLDFAYLPVDFKSQAGLGYAFINFITTEEAQRCFEVFEGFCDWKVPSEKRCTVTWGSPYQGLEAHIERYQNSPVMHHSLADEWKPILLQDGVRVPFPAPTKPIKTPKIRQQVNAD